MPSEYEDKYLLLRDENTALKKKKNEQEATIKRMYTKLAIIEEALKKKRQADEKNNQEDPETGGNKATIVPVRRDLDTEKFVAALKNENALLRKKNQTLMEKNRWLEEQNRQSATAKRRSHSAVSASRTAMKTKKSAGRTTPTNLGEFAGSTLKEQTKSARNLHRDTFSGDLEVALKKRLVIAEKQLMKLQKENEQLRGNSNRLILKPRRDNNADSGPSDEEEDDRGDNNAEPTQLEIDQLKRELRDRQAQLAILNARYENLESNALAEREIQEKTLTQMEQLNRQVHKLRNQLQDALMENEELEIKLAKAGDQEKDIALLREQNRRLEERMTSLCESPFINDAFQRKERIDKLFDLEKLTQEQKTTISHMTEENQKLQAIIRELQSSIKQLKHGKDRLEQDLEQMAHHLMEERNARSLEAIKSSSRASPALRPEPVIVVRPRSPEPLYRPPPEKRDACSSPVHRSVSPVATTAIPVNAVGSMVRRNYGDLPTSDNFLDITDDDDRSVKHLRNRVHVLQLAHLKSMQELERCEKMLQAQTNINRELALEIEELTTQQISSSNQLQRRMKELELLCEERQQRIHGLQAEIKQLKYAREKLLLKAREADDARSDDSTSDDDASEVASLSESLIFAARDLAPGEQLLELGISSGTFDSSVVGINSSTFVLCDFYDFESQTTPLLMGSHPEYNLSATFKVTVDGFFLRYLASESIVLEVYQSVRGDFKLIGKASVRLSKLLQSKGVLKDPTLEIKSINRSDNDETTAVGTLNVILRLSTPISEIWQVHLRSYPQDSQLLSMGGKSNSSEIIADVLGGDDFKDDIGHITNELQITVFACRNLRSYRKRSDKLLSRIPSSYAHYQLLGFPDVFTNIVTESSNPEYDLNSSRQAFILDVDACLLRFLSKFRFWITVFDDQADLDDSSQDDGLIGRCGIMLSDLVNGESIRGWFPLKDQNDQRAGDVSILIQWKDPFQVLQLSTSQRTRGVNGRPIDLNSLDFDQQHALLSMFSADMDGRINYRQFLHYAAPSEELELVVAKLKERFECAIDSEQVSSVQDALAAVVEAGQRKRMHVSVKSMTKAFEKYGIFLSDTELELLLSIFGASDFFAESRSTRGNAAESTERTDRMIALNYLLLHINPRRSCADRLLCHKIRQTVRGYLQEQGKRKPADIVPPSMLFEKFDEAKYGRVTRSEFRKCISALGFDLLNVESEYRELVRSHAIPSTPGNDNAELIANNTTIPPPQENVDLDETTIKDCGAKIARPIKQSQGCSPEELRSPAKVTQKSKMKVSELTVSTAPATTEFQRRKQTFMDRMKAIASASSKNLVYEQVEKKLQTQQVLMKTQSMPVLPRQDILQQQVRKLHVPTNTHHDAARTLQRQYRQYREQQQQRRQVDQQTILEVDHQLRNLFSKWTIEDLNGLEDQLIQEIEDEIPEAKRTGLVARKQLSYFLSKIPRVALPPTLLWQLMDYFSVKKNGLVAYRSLLHFICTTSTDESKAENKQYLPALAGLYLDVGYASQVFVSTGDMNGTGTISFKKFRECLARLGANLSAMDLRLVVIMFDASGFEILYHSLLYSLTQVPHCRDLSETLRRCRQFGISSLRDSLLAFINSEDGLMSQEELLRVLMLQGSRFKASDATLLYHMMAGIGDSAKRISIHELCLRLETASKYDHRALKEDWNKYDMGQLQRLAWNCRKLICGSHADLTLEFERFDWRQRGFVTLSEFVEVARRNGFLLLTVNQLNGIAKKFGVKTNGVFGVNYRQFLDWTTPPPPIDMDTIEEKLHNFARAQADNLLSKLLSDLLASWSKAFATKSIAGATGFISRSNFVTICKNHLGLPLNDDEMRTVLYTYDPNLDDEIDFGAFLRMNWREAITTRQKQIKPVKDAPKFKDLVQDTKENVTDPQSIEREHLKASSEVKQHKQAVKIRDQKFVGRETSKAPTDKQLQKPLNILSDLVDWCDERGIDFRGEFELHDRANTGLVTAMELKQTLVRLGIGQRATASPEAVIGQLVRQFRNTEQKDAVDYRAMLYEAVNRENRSADPRWYSSISESLRSRICSKAKIAGKIDFSDTTIYSKLDVAFSHFDRDKKGFLTAEGFGNGLRALNYDLTAEQLEKLLARISIFRHDGGGLSRTEFDSFVLDPYGARLLRKLSQQLYSEVKDPEQGSMPRVAYLSRLLMESGRLGHQNNLPKEVVWSRLERALEREVTPLERVRLQHLFDVNRDGQIAYKLFLKVISQWRKTIDNKQSAHGDESEQRPKAALQHPRRDEEISDEKKPPCARDAILRSLYNQMSSIDFMAQLDIVQEYLTSKDRGRTGSIKSSKLKRLFDQIGLSLSEDAFMSLQMYYPTSDSEGQEECVSYAKLLLALERIHEEDDDNNRK